MNLLKCFAMMICAALALCLPATRALAETYLVHVTARIDQTTVPYGWTLPAQYAVGSVMRGVFEVESSRTRHIKAVRSEGRGAMRYTRTPKALSFDVTPRLSYRNGRLLVTADGAARWSNAESYCTGYAATRNLFCTAAGSIEVSDSASEGATQSHQATYFMLSLPAGMDPKLKLEPALKRLVLLAANGQSKLILGFSNVKGAAEDDKIRLLLSVTSMAFEIR